MIQAVQVTDASWARRISRAVSTSQEQCAHYSCMYAQTLYTQFAWTVACKSLLRLGNRV